MLVQSNPVQFSSVRKFVLTRQDVEKCQQTREVALPCLASALPCLLASRPITSRLLKAVQSMSGGGGVVGVVVGVVGGGGGGVQIDITGNVHV